MLKDQVIVITNTWECDSCKTNEVTEINPFFSISISIPAFSNYQTCEVDLCSNCINNITDPAIHSYILDLPPFIT